MEEGSLTLYALVLIFSLLFYLIKNRYAYWKKRGIPCDEPHFLFGNLKGIRKTVGFFEVFSNVYNKYKGTGPFAGFFEFTSPSVVLLDLDLVKDVLIKDFNNFESRANFYNERDDPVSAHLFALDGSKWRTLRGKLSPTFTSSKIKFMFPTIVSVAEKFVKVLEEEAKINPDTEVKEILSRFTTDIIGTCAFGIDCNSLSDPNAEFRQIGKKIFSNNVNYLLLHFAEAFPTLARNLHVKAVPSDVSSFFIKIVKETVSYREKNNVQRNDFMDLLIDLKNKTPIRLENGEQLKPLTLIEIVSQSAVFFAAGFETSSTTMGFSLYALALNQDVQDKLRKEINEVIARHNGDITYDGINEMAYLDQVVCETLRKFPPVTSVRRRAKAAYPTNDPKYIIPKGARVFVPVIAIHSDPEIYAKPEVFDPERFSPEEVQKRHPMSWLPFGDGPRNCIGLRFAKMLVGIGLAMLIKNFKFSVIKDTPIPMKFNKKPHVLTSERKIVLKVEKI